MKKRLKQILPDTVLLFMALLWVMPLQAALLANDMWKVEAGDNLESILTQVFPDKPNLRNSMESIVRKLNPSAFDKTTGQLLPGSVLRIPGAKPLKQKTQPISAKESEQKLNQSKPVARVLIAKGDIKATDSQGNVRKLQRKSPVYEGDFLETLGDSKTQLRFTDGALLALRPNTRFKIETYHYDGTQNGEEKGIFSLLKGGFRTITGLIGSLNKESYSVKTTVATIGIRGTHYGLRLCESGSDCGQDGDIKGGLYGGVIDGGVVVRNKAGEKVFHNDQYFHVASASLMPKGIILAPGVVFDGTELKRNIQNRLKKKQSDDQQRIPERLRHKDRAKPSQLPHGAGGNPMQSSVATHLAQNQPRIDQPVFTAGEDTTQFTDTGGTATYDLPPLPGNAAPEDAAVAVSFLHKETLQGAETLLSASGSIIADGSLDHLILLNNTADGNVGYIPVGIRDNESSQDRRFSSGDAVLRDVGGDPGIGVSWGRWEGAYRLAVNDQALSGVGSMHFMYSPNVTPTATLYELGALGSQVNFSVAGGTHPTDYLGNAGLLEQAYMTVDFMGLAVTSYALQVRHNEDVYIASLRTPVLFDDLFATQGGDDRLPLTGSVCVNCSLQPSTYTVNGGASLLFLNEGDIQASGAMSTFSLATDALDANMTVPVMGTSGAILFKRDLSIIPR